jgi:hypothetical protein
MREEARDKMINYLKVLLYQSFCVFAEQFSLMRIMIEIMYAGIMWLTARTASSGAIPPRSSQRSAARKIAFTQTRTHRERHTQKHAHEHT